MRALVAWVKGAYFCKAFVEAITKIPKSSPSLKVDAFPNFMELDFNTSLNI